MRLKRPSQHSEISKVSSTILESPPESNTAESSGQPLEGRLSNDGECIWNADAVDHTSVRGNSGHY